jgi:glucosamine--fructose-6-phosphate aminotransferase (isomerizing)
MTSFDPQAPLAAAGSPWQSLPPPSVRDGPPYHMTDMIAAEPFVAGRILDRLADPQGPAGRLGGAIGQAASSGASIVVTGCGTSEHAAQGIALIIRDALRAGGLPHGPTAVISAQAFELSLEPPTGGLVIGVSHEGGTEATIRALEASLAAGARTALITASAGAPASAPASPELILETFELDHSWCHTIGYLSPLLAGAATGAHLSGLALDAALAADLLAAGASDAIGAETIAAAIGDARTLLVVGSGADRPAARELALKVEEASWLPSAMRDLETFLHGHLPATDGSTALILILTDRSGRVERVARARQVLAAAGVVGPRAAAIIARGLDDELAPELTPAGRLLVDEAPDLPAPVAALLGSATPLQLLTERIARARGTNPDLIRRDDPIYRAAADAADD